MNTLFKAIQTLRPGALFSIPKLDNVTLADVIWHDATVPPAQAELDAAMVKVAANQTILDQITALEGTITPRRMREAVLGTDGGWLADVNNQIAALRAQL